MKKKIGLIILLAGILFPFAALTEFSNSYATAFNFVFHTQTAHILMHSALFAALSWVVMSFVSKKPMKQIVFFCLGSVLGVALVQESIQMISTHTSRYGDSLFDIGVDLIAGFISLAIYWFVRKRRLVKNITP